MISCLNWVLSLLLCRCLPGGTTSLGRFPSPIRTGNEIAYLTTPAEGLDGWTEGRHACRRQANKQGRHACSAGENLMKQISSISIAQENTCTGSTIVPLQE
ncbi:hypothetical protein PVAP13_6KG126140 [Panicum virgatum]|uniref:Secreted protein n=1 Tax=Panicum virgatum TaxID=38727 RepID=A0A8T0R9W7_PANVG|nr:hypothetical protein PVAP13_6KG126140 [Panicum virgatum]